MTELSRGALRGAPILYLLKGSGGNARLIKKDYSKSLIGVYLYISFLTDLLQQGNVDSI